MTTMSQDSGVVDMSGVVSSILQTYQNAVAGYQKMITADPDALQSLSTSYTDQVTKLGAVSSDLGQQTNTLSSTWTGSAYQAFRTASGQLGGQVDAIAHVLGQEAQRLSAASSLLRAGMSQMDSVIKQFQQYSQMLIAEAKNAAASAAGAFVNAAQQLGNSSVTAAKNLVDQVGTALAGLYGTGAAGEAAATGPESKHGGSSEFDQNKLVKRQLADQPWFKDWYKKTYGKAPDPDHLRFGALNWFSSSNPLDGRRRPQSAPFSTFTNSGWYKLTSDGLQSAGTPLKANTPFGSLAGPGEDASTAAKLMHDTKITLGSTGTQTLSDHTLFDDKAEGSVDTGYGTLGGKAEVNGGLQVTGDANATIYGNQLQAGGDIKATVFDANASGAYTAGPLSLAGKGDAYVGADLSGHGSVGLTGVSAHVNAFAGAEAKANFNADVAGVGVGVSASAQAGIGAQFDGQLTMNNWHLIGNLKAGVAVGVGGSVGGSIDVDLPKVVHNVGEYGGAAVNYVEGAASSVYNAAGQAATALGNAFSQAPPYLGP
ncbi:MAG TPA: WXG100 family type VII secretion target [Pseudonocardiaceae bacterium]|nr:WXG100 family type VII secretion target [Pseudonocardiaceae bacterium]